MWVHLALAMLVYYMHLYATLALGDCALPQGEIWPEVKKKKKKKSDGLTAVSAEDIVGEYVDLK